MKPNIPDASNRPAPAKTSGLNLPMPVWDIPTRLFHWVLVCLVLLSYVSDRKGWMRIHVYSGYSVLLLLVFRVIWGLVGSETARFVSFLKSPVAALQHLAHFTRREPDTEIGHNAAGGWMVVGMLLLLGAQVTTGLFANDDGATEGPLVKFVTKESSDFMSKLHGLNFNLILAVVVMHVLAVIAYAVVKRHDLVQPMIMGKKRLPAAMRAPAMVTPLLAAGIVVVLAATGAIVLRIL